MSGLGIVMGLVFPFFVLVMGVPSIYVLTPGFFASTLAAGCLVGMSNQMLSRAVVGSRLKTMKLRMAKVEKNLRYVTLVGEQSEIDIENLSLPVDSDDELGESALSFNHLVDALTESQRTNSMARHFGVTLASHVDLGPLLDAALPEIQAVGNFAAAAVCLLEDGEMQVAKSSGLVDPEVVAGSEQVKRSCRDLDMVHLDLPDDVRLDGGVVSFRPRTVLIYPIHVRMVPLGVLVLASAGEVSVSDISLVQQLMSSFAIAVSQALGHRRLQHVAAVDGLTGLLNRRFGLERLGQDFARAVRSNEPLGVIIFDIDHFKAVNDTHGHHVGDEVLRGVAQSLQGVLREGDTLMRYGGEEFLAVLPGAGDNDLLMLGERIRTSVQAGVVRGPGYEVETTVSLGAAAYPGPDIGNVDELIQLADGALYAAKNSGRNRLMLVNAGSYR